MKSALLARLGALTVVALTAAAGVASPTGHSNSFRAALTGDVRETISGKATFGRIETERGAAHTFTLSLGTASSRGAVLFTSPGSGELSVGSYAVSDIGNGSDQVQGLVMLGPADRPEGVFRAQSGTLTITSVSDHLITGHFVLDANGFLKPGPEREDQRVSVSGSFTALADD